MSECGLEREAIQELLPGHFCIVRLGGEEEPTKEAEKEQPAVERKLGEHGVWVPSGKSVSGIPASSTVSGR